MLPNPLHGAATEVVRGHLPNMEVPRTVRQRRVGFGHSIISFELFNSIANTEVGSVCFDVTRYVD